jgi:hypothetical protein
MWVIVAVTLGFTGQPKPTIIPGAESQTEAVRATHVCTNFDSDRRDISFSVCMTKDSVQIGPPSGLDAQKKDSE